MSDYQQSLLSFRHHHLTPYLSMIKSENINDFLEIDYFTQKSLEILKNMSGNDEGSLISCIDETKTASGARLLKQRIIEPFYLYVIHHLILLFFQLTPFLERFLAKLPQLLFLHFFLLLIIVYQNLL